MGADENTVANFEATVEGCKVLNLALVADHNIDVDIDVLSNDAIPAYVRLLSKLGPMPNR
jgi:hypothetical protein